MSYNEISDEDEYKKKGIREKERVFLVATFCFIICFGCALAFCLTSCTISLSNISTHGTATDLVDEQQSPTTEIDPEISIPAIGM